MNVYINDIQKFLPFEPINNDEMEDYLGLIGGKKSRARKIILRSNGIKSRYYVLEKHTQKPLLSNAQITAKSIKKLDINLDKIECLCCGTTTPDQLLPNHTLMTQGELGISQIETLSASGICLSGVNALKYAYLGIKSGEFKNAVSTGSEVASLVLRAQNFKKESDVKGLKENGALAFEKDFLRWMLSDGAGSMLLESKPNKDKLSLEIEWIEIISYAGQMPPCMYSGCKVDKGQVRGWRTFSQDELMEESILSVQQNVKLLNEHIIDYTITKPLLYICKKRNLNPDDITYFLPHYSSEFFKPRVYEGLKKADFEISYEKWFTNLTYCGNTGAASIYIMLEEFFCSNKLKKGDTILCYIPESGRFSTAFIKLKAI